MQEITKWSRARGIWAPAACLAFTGTLAHCTSPVKKNVHDRPWTDITVLDSPEMAFTNFLGKNHKSIGQEAA